MSTSAPESESPVKRASDLAYTDRPATELNPSRPYSAIKFADLCELFEAVRGVNQTGLKGSERKRALLDAWHRTFCITEGPRTGAFDLYRLILPTVDKERAAYKLKEAALAHCLGLALGLKRGHSPDFLKLEGWRKSGKGNFAQTVYDVCKGHRPPHLGDVRRATVGDVNAALDRLSELNNVKEKVPILRSLIDNMDAGQVRWLVAIIIKDLKLGGAVPSSFIVSSLCFSNAFQILLFKCLPKMHRYRWGTARCPSCGTSTRTRRTCTMCAATCAACARRCTPRTSASRSRTCTRGGDVHLLSAVDPQRLPTAIEPIRRDL
jgi:hypothetical protein